MQLRDVMHERTRNGTARTVRGGSGTKPLASASAARARRGTMGLRRSGAAEERRPGLPQPRSRTALLPDFWRPPSFHIQIMQRCWCSS